MPESLFAKYPHVQRVKSSGGRSYVVSIPRYQEFTWLAVRLAKDDVHFVQIAGNDVIVVSAIVRGWTYATPEERVLFSEKFLTQPDSTRIVRRSWARSTSCHSTGVETVGTGRARSE